MNRLQKRFLTSATITFSVVMAVSLLFAVFDVFEHPRMTAITFASNLMDSFVYAVAIGVGCGVWDALGMVEEVKP